ncbi:acyl-CoA-binding protein (ACBP)/diazepam binding inhibitor (DBI)/endozepine (EP) [Paecilomyces lecythidis]|uniref:Acyl-CoA-binding protein (ACBP)/diazepam binding inhibitor (DBI)/endozepine (EP) n=1 Tax=Paecilomyces lecythidis TaxID=3004212 RepID=A0ABR3YBL1_9EURO
MSDYDEKIYKDALKAAQPELGDGAEAVAKAFAVAYAQVKTLKQAPEDKDKLRLYGLSKQALQDPPFEQRQVPGMFDIKRKAMDRAWKEVVDEHLTPAKAQEEYTKLVNFLINKLGTQ